MMEKTTLMCDELLPFVQYTVHVYCSFSLFCSICMWKSVLTHYTMLRNISEKLNHIDPLLCNEVAL